MKAFILLVLINSFASANSFACPDFSGKYFNDDPHLGHTVAVFVQNGCESIAMTISFSWGQTVNPTEIIDGAQHVTQDDQSSYTAYTASWSGDKISMNSVVINRKTGQSANTVALNYLDAGHNFVSESDITQNGQTKHETVVFKRYASVLIPGYK